MRARRALPRERRALLLARRALVRVRRASELAGVRRCGHGVHWCWHGVHWRGPSRFGAGTACTGGGAACTRSWLPCCVARYGALQGNEETSRPSRPAASRAFRAQWSSGGAASAAFRDAGPARPAMVRAFDALRRVQSGATAEDPAGVEVFRVTPRAIVAQVPSRGAVLPAGAHGRVAVARCCAHSWQRVMDAAPSDASALQRRRHGVRCWRSPVPYRCAVLHAACRESRRAKSPSTAAVTA